MRVPDLIKSENVVIAMTTVYQPLTTIFAALYPMRIIGGLHPQAKTAVLDKGFLAIRVFYCDTSGDKGIY